MRPSEREGKWKWKSEHTFGLLNTRRDTSPFTPFLDYKRRPWVTSGFKTIVKTNLHSEVCFRVGVGVKNVGTLSETLSRFDTSLRKRVLLILFVNDKIRLFKNASNDVLLSIDHIWGCHYYKGIDVNYVVKFYLLTLQSIVIECD